MIPFYVNAFFILIVDVIIHISTENESNQRKYICFFNTLQIILFVALRGESVGNDTQNYVNFFRQVVNNPSIALTREVYEIGFRWYVYLIAKITSDPRVFLTISAIISIIPFGVMIYKYSKDCMLSFYSFCTMEFIMFSMTGMRQNIAYFFVYTSFVLFQSKKTKWKMVAFCLIGVSGFFHRSAWAFSILYIIMMIKNIRLKKVIYLVGVVVAFIFRNQIGQVFIERFFNDYQISATNAYSRIFMVGIVLLLSIIYYDLITYRSAQSLILYNRVSIFPSLVDAMFLTTFFFIIALSVSASARQGRYFFVFFVLLLPELQYAIKEDQRWLFKDICYIMLSFLILYLFPHNGLCTYGYYLW